MRPVVLRKRRDFVLAANRGQRLGLPGLNLQARRRRAEEPAEAPVRVGYTCSKKVGGAVQRNRAKRRLRAAAAQVLPGAARPGWDYVLIGRRDATAERPFPELLEDLAAGVARLHAREDKAAVRGEREPGSVDPAPSFGRGKGAAKGKGRGGPSGRRDGR
ncbi:ribonuclease P protein component [Albimonas sp. CAU 1670]|uniref:ribonuclease P protein component n=1 Tax=Albimonas sp. CAU 1670 TaxID=3032599 RepID=UPI0023DCDF8A|nr:ribonuclease P protein component [Albimonas sp. CAU 1670]MDF2234489.1 ribonuclease P protein component [Albimonas sp. CAU 1670]